MTQKGYRQRRACALAGIDPRVYRSTSKRPVDTELRARLKDLSSERRRFGYRRLHILLKHEGWQVNWKKLYRIYKEEGLTAHADDTWVLGALPERASHELSDEGGHANNSGADYVGEVLRSRRRYSEDSVGVQRRLISRRHGSARLPGATARTPRCYWLGRGHCHCSARLYAAATWRCPGSHG